MNDKLGQLATEQANGRFADLDLLSTAEVLRLMNEEDARIHEAVAGCMNAIALSVERVSDRLRSGGRLFYVGAGTSGRLGALDAYECPPTFGTEPSLVQALLAGGPAAQANEEAEDDEAQGVEDLRKRMLTDKDAVVGIAASGRTPYVIGALQYARQTGAATIALSCNLNSEIGLISDIAIEVPVGSEVLAGSTRLKAGTAQKMVLNMISTASMIRLGKVYMNYMVDMQASNEKLRARCKRIVSQATGAEEAAVSAALKASGYNAKIGIVMLLANVDAREAERLLTNAQGRIRDALLLVKAED